MRDLGEAERRRGEEDLGDTGKGKDCEGKKC